jgi:hypothetical protein
MVSTQAPEQSVVPPPQLAAHEPALQTSPAAQAASHAPQWLGLTCVSTQEPPHSVEPLPHDDVQVPLLQISPAPQALPQAPQFAGSLAVSTQSPSQSVSGQLSVTSLSPHAAKPKPTMPVSITNEILLSMVMASPE